MKKLSKDKVLVLVKNSLLVLLGTFILALGTESFIIPADLNVGGMSGIAVCFKHLGVTISSELIITICCWTLFVIGLIFLGWSFSVQTLLSTIFYPVCLFFINFLLKKLNFLLIANSLSLNGDQAMVFLLSALFGGIFTGVGCAITFIGGGSTGGTDIIAFIICKFVKKAKSSIVIFLCDASIIILGFIFDKSHDLALCLEGVMSAFIAALVIDKIFIGSNRTFVAYIVTDKYQEITNDIISIMERTTSIIDVEGGYTKEMKKMVMVSFSMREYSKVMNIVSKNDKRAFMSINIAHEINGEGFKPIK